jgi:hypothetical protein
MALYGILDCAVDPSLHGRVDALPSGRAACLFAGSLPPEIAAVAPYLVELSPTDPLSRAWRAEGWGRNWGLLLVSEASLTVVRRRLRHFTQVRLPSGSGPVLFRFWDPRVFRVYMPLTEPDETKQWFTDIDRYIVETEDGKGSLSYTFDGGAVSAQPGPPPAQG